MAGQFGLATEGVAWGTSATPTKFIEPDSVTHSYDPGLVPIDGIRASRRLPRPPKPGGITAGGSLSTKFPNSGGIATLLKHIFGAVVTTGSGPYVHTYTLGSAPSATLQLGIQEESGTVKPYTHIGSKFHRAEIGMAVGQAVMLKADWSSKDVVRATALASASYVTALNPFIFTEGSVSLDGAAVASANAATLVLEKGLKTDKHTLSSRYIREQREEPLWKITGTIDCDFEDNDMVESIVARDELDLVFAMDNGVDDLTITAKAFLSGEFPSLTTNGSEPQRLAFTINAAGSDASAFSPVLTNDEPSAA